MNYYDRQPRKSQASQAQHYVYVQTRVSTADGEGGFSEQWTSGASAIPAAISPIQARQLFEYRSVNVDATHLIKVRGHTTVTEKDRILYGTRVFEILTVENIQERDFIKVITCKEVR